MEILDKSAVDPSTKMIANSLLPCNTIPFVPPFPQHLQTCLQRRQISHAESSSEPCESIEHTPAVSGAGDVQSEDEVRPCGPCLPMSVCLGMSEKVEQLLDTPDDRGMVE